MSVIYMRMVCTATEKCRMHRNGAPATSKCPGLCEEKGCAEETCSFDDLVCEKHLTLELAKKNLKIFRWGNVQTLSQYASGSAMAVALSKEEAVSMILRRYAGYRALDPENMSEHDLGYDQYIYLKKELNKTEPSVSAFEPFGTFTIGSA